MKVLQRRNALAVTILVPVMIAVTTAQSTYHQYRLSEVGTFGGPVSGIATGPAFAFESYWNQQGEVVGGAESSTEDPFFPNCFESDCLVSYAFAFENNQLNNLGALQSGYNSLAYGINNGGLVVGISENGMTDAATGYPQYRAVTWKNGAIANLGTLGGAVSQAFAVNNRGEVVGVAANTLPDQYSVSLGPCTTLNCWPVTTQQRAMLWRAGMPRDLGTLGGDDAVAYFVNNAGQVAGVSYTNDNPNGTTGIPTQAPFLWDNGRMANLGTLGGTVGIVFGLNNRGQVAGQSNLPGDQYYHAFLWGGGGMRDLGTLGGHTSTTYWLDNAGDVVGASKMPGDQTFQAFLWVQGHMSNLGTLPGDVASWAGGVNASRTAVGTSCPSSACTSSTAVLWNSDRQIVDLNALVPSGSNLHLYAAIAIADSGEILALGTLQDGEIRAAVLTPAGDCNTECEQRIQEPQPFSAPVRLTGAAAEAMKKMVSRIAPEAVR